MANGKQQWGIIWRRIYPIDTYSIIIPIWLEQKEDPAVYFTGTAALIRWIAPLTMKHLGTILMKTLQWRHNERDGLSNHQCRVCILNSLFLCRSKKTSKLCVTGLCVGNSPVTGEFPAQRASNAENVSIWWRHHGLTSIRQELWYNHNKAQ